MRTLVLTLFLAAAFFGPVGAVEDDRLATIHLPEGFVIEPFAEVPNARQMAWGEKGTLFVGTRREGRVFAVTDEDGDGRGERVREVASGLRMPSGVAFRDGALYVAAVSTILRFDDIESRLDDPPTPVIVTDRLPSDGHHGWKVLEFGPDGHLYFPVGAPCDVCRTEGYHGTILRMRPNGSGIEIYARGLRNSVGLAWHPVTGELWFTDNGSDHLGPELPPDELNRAPGPGLHYGFPFCHAGTLPDPVFGDDGRCADSEAPSHRPWARTSRRSASPFIPEPTCRKPIGARCLLRNTDPETGAERLVTGSRSCASPTTTEPRWATRHLPKDGTATGGRGDGRPTSWRHPTAQSWCPTIGPGKSTSSGTWVDKRPRVPPLARPGQIRWLRVLDLNLASPGI